MSNTYAEASFTIPAKTDEHKKFVTDALEGVCEIQSGDGGPTDWFPAQVLTVAKERSFNFEDAIIPEWADMTNGITIYSEMIDTGLMIVIIQAYLRKFHPEHCFGFTFSISPSPHSGGAVYIDDKEVTIHTCEEWLDGELSEACQGGGSVLT